MTLTSGADRDVQVESARSSRRAAAAAGRPRAVRSRRSRARPARCRGSPGPGPSPSRRISPMLASTSGRSIAGLRIEPRSPPVQVATSTSTPRRRTSPWSPRPCSTRRPGAHARAAAAGARPGGPPVARMGHSVIVPGAARASPTPTTERPSSLGRECTHNGQVSDAAERLRRRYPALAGAPTAADRRWSASVCAIALGWLIWAALFHSRPAVAAQVSAYTVVSDTAIDVTLTVERRDPAQPVTCRVLAQAADFSAGGRAAGRGGGQRPPRWWTSRSRWSPLRRAAHRRSVEGLHDRRESRRQPVDCDNVDGCRKTRPRPSG